MSQELTAVIDTTKGKIHLKLFGDKTPLTVGNFVNLATRGYYNGLTFHRVIPNFMIQGGGFTKDMSQKKTHAPVKNEARSDVPNKRGTLAMARTAVVDSATSQFFINLKDNGFLDHKNSTDQGFGYCVFGKLIEGEDVLDKIGAVKTGQSGPHGDVPVTPVVIESVTIEE